MLKYNRKLYIYIYKIIYNIPAWSRVISDTNGKSLKFATSLLLEVLSVTAICFLFNSNFGFKILNIYTGSFTFASTSNYYIYFTLLYI